MTGGMMFEGTPGPWRYEEYEDSISGMSVRVVGADGELVCDSEPYYAHRLDPKNGPLIAAAPELLEALQLFVHEYVELVDSGDAGYWNAEDEVKVIKARSAIAKALGEQK